MKKILIFLLLTSCASSNRRLPVDINNNVKVAEDLIEQGAVKFWPELKDYKPLVLINHHNTQYLLNSNTYPNNGYYYFNDTIRHPLGIKIKKRPYHTAYLSKMHKGLENSIFMIDSQETMSEKGQNWNDYDWITIYIHEVFHLFQNNKLGQQLVLSPNKMNTDALISLKKNKSYIDSINQEVQLVRNAVLKLDLQKASNKINTCRDLIKHRENRFKNFKINNDTKASELFYETVEGTARYFEKHIDLQAMKNPKLNKLMNAELLNYYAKYGRKTFEYMITPLDQNSNYYYDTGFFLSILLDKISPDWKQDAFKTTLWDQFKHACKK
ncbi:hypothetical protein [Halobacteriovorax sp. RZ-2]|uniref:hypothetical protein n=1 Tax=unclassified Halobacteriovorax TaxID=2639665 RepID=UPI0037187856